MLNLSLRRSLASFYYKLISIFSDILKVKDKLFKLFEIAGLDTNADELKILNHPPEIAGSHPPEKAGSRPPEKAGSRPPEMAGWRPPEMAGSRPLNKPLVQNVISQALTSDNKSVFKLQPDASVQHFLGSASQTIVSSPMSAAHTSTGIKQEKLSPTGSLLSSGSTIPSGSLPHRQLSNFHSEVKLEPGIGKLAIPNQRDLHPDVPCKIKQEPWIVTEFYDPQTGRKRKQPSPGKQN